MISREFDIVLAVILGLLMVLCFLGKAGGIMDMFGPRNDTGKKKRTAEEDRLYQRYIGYFILPLFVLEVITAITELQVMGLVIAAVAVADLIVFAMLTKGK